MKPSRTFLARIFMKDEQSVRSVWPFFTILSVIVTAFFVRDVLQEPRLQQPLLLIPLVLLLAAFILLFWLSPFLISTVPKTWLILGIHGAIAFALVTLAGSSQLAYPVYMGMIGVTVGIFQKNWQRALGVAIYLALSTLNLYLLGDRGALTAWYTMVAPMAVFVVVYVILYTREALARERAQLLLSELEEANRQLAEYAGRIEQLERQRMARELHDTLAQGLAGLILQLEAADSHLSNQRDERAQQIVQQAMQRARTTLAEARRAIDNLRAAANTAESLAESIRSEARHFEEVTGASCQVELHLPESLPAAVGEQALRMVSEGLTNIARHAAARHAWVTLQSKDGSLLVEVRDDGVGFSSEEGKASAGHYGLLGLRERARLAGGALDIESQAGMGTLVRLRLPL